MRTLLHHYARVAVVVLALTLILSALPTAARAAAPTVTVIGAGVGTCDGRPVPALAQGASFDVVLNDFPIAPISITLTLPDGRILSPDEAALLPAVPGPGSYFAPPGGATTVPAPYGISSSFTYASALTWPTGCYAVTATQGGLPPTLTASTAFRVLALPHSAQAGNLKLTVQAAGTSQPTGQQPMPGNPPLSVSIFGQGVPPGAALTIQIVQPNGAIIAGPSPTVYPDGSFNLPGGYAFTNLHQSGMHTVFATVSVPNPLNPAQPTTYTAQAQFNLTAAPVAPTSNATLELIAPFNALAPRGVPIIIQGRKFISAPPAPGPLSLTLVLPNGVRLGAATAVDPSGNAAIGPFLLGNGYPTGVYRIIATQAAVGSTPARAATLTWRLIAQ